MPSIVEKFENDLKDLSSRDKAALAHFLIEELEGRIKELKKFGVKKLKHDTRLIEQGS